nr:tyrosine-protein phosphatase [Streptomyces meridianus]
MAHDGAAELRQALDVIAAGDRVVFHCASGKDRTGLLAALVLSLVGVGEDDVAADFELTEAATDRLIADWRADHPGRRLVWPGYGRAPQDVIRRFLAEPTERYGSVHGYARQRLGVDDALVDALRKGLLNG